MNYEEYVKLQTYGDIVKPIKYHIGEWKVLCEFLEVHGTSNEMVLDVGCGSGYGVGMLNLLGYWDVLGIDLNLEKINLGKHFGYNVIAKDILDFSGEGYSIIWCSHAFEHMYDPEKALQKLLDITTDDARFYFILPYPNLDPAPAHCSSKALGLTEDDNGWAVTAWFESRGLYVIDTQFSTFREPEIWMELRKRL